MKPTNFPYTSVHDYLDQIFDQQIPDRQSIINAKREYWRLYNRYLKRWRRKQLRFIRISLTHNQHQELVRIAEIKGLSPSALLKTYAKNPSMAPSTDKEQTMNEIQKICFESLHHLQVEPTTIEDLLRTAKQGLVSIISLTEQTQQL